MIPLEQLKEQGYCIIKNLVEKSYLAKLEWKLENSFSKHREIQIRNGNDIVTEGVALHVILDSNVFIDFLQYLINRGLIEFIRDGYFKSPFILNSFSGLNNVPNQPNFSSVVHRDLRFYTGDISVMLNVLVLLDDFTTDNGPTLLLPGSHKEARKPTDEEFHERAIKVLGKAGDILLFNSNVWHCSSKNNTDKPRRALPITFTKSLIKQLLDYPRAIGYDKMDTFSPELQQLLGYYARVPASLDEWYQPFEKRFYKKDQD